MLLKTDRFQSTSQIVFALTATIWLLQFVFREPLTFDDAYMFHRYAVHLLNGLGCSWNPDGIPTYGLTSQVWLLVVLPFVLSWPDAAVLQFASWLTGGLAIAVTAYAVVRQASSSTLRKSMLVIGLVGLPLLLHPAFNTQLTTGMDTMLSMVANATVMLSAIEYRKKPSKKLAVVSGLVSIAAFPTRPENAVCAIAVPLIAFAVPFRRRW